MVERLLVTGSTKIQKWATLAKELPTHSSPPKKIYNKEKSGRWAAKFIASLLALAAIWVRIQTSLINTKMGDISK